MKLSKQDRDAQLIKVIKTDRSTILQRLLRDSIFEQEDRIDERIEKVFDKVAKNNKTFMD